MGLFSSLFSPRHPARRTQWESLHDFPGIDDLTYPVDLPGFDALAEDDHADPRAAVYPLLCLNPSRRRPFSCDGLSALDFGGGANAASALTRLGLISELPPDKILSALYSADELKGLLRDRGLPVGGNKDDLAGRLFGCGFKPSPQKYRRKLYQFTEAGAALWEEYHSDMDSAILQATNALKGRVYFSAVSAYRSFDSKWGFSHTSGKVHTIFAHYYIPLSRFEFMDSYPMQELINSEDFKSSLRACLFAGLMRGCQEKLELADCFCSVCREPIRCPNIVDLFSADPDDDRSGYMLASMRRNAASDSRYVLEYYISHLLYLSRRA